MRYERVVILLLDSVGVGAMPDAAAYGEVDPRANTLAHVAAAARHHEYFSLPNLAHLGLGHLGPFDGVRIVDQDKLEGHFGRMALASPGKDTVTGHWEIGGVVLDEPFTVAPQGFSPEIIEAFKRETGHGVLANKAASGTAILEELGAEHLETGKLIVYTSADSVFQIAAHEERVPLEELYRVCEITRRLLDPHRVARVIARPFLGAPGSFARTHNRKDYALAPPYPTLLERLQEKGVPVIGIGKIKNIFAERGVDVSIHTSGNADGIRATMDALGEHPRGLIFTNLVDFDMLYGHRNDPLGYGRSLLEVDEAVPALRKALGPDTLLVVTADHGCDPTLVESTDHTREYVPLLVTHDGLVGGVDLGTRSSLADLGQTIAVNFGTMLPNGESFLSQI